jgi:hypothetical protein
MHLWYQPDFDSGHWQTQYNVTLQTWPTSGEGTVNLTDAWVTWRRFLETDPRVIAVADKKYVVEPRELCLESDLSVMEVVLTDKERVYLVEIWLEIGPREIVVTEKKHTLWN